VGTEVSDLIAQTLAPYRSSGAARITAKGPRLMLRPQVGVALIMVLHELATNAAKYGALSVPTGQLAITWHENDEGPAARIHLDWSEMGGPKVTPPMRQGFGTKLIERSTAHELGGEARLEFLKEGLRCELIFPWAGRPAVPNGVV
jgi:two-component system, chemotaxis family, CheB/CheR fusion protein